MKTKSKRSHFQCEFRTYKNGVLQYEDLDHRFTAVRLEDYIKRYQARFEKMGYTVEFKNVVNLDEEGTEFHSAIKETRIKHGLSIKQVSDMTSVPYRSLQNWEAGVRKCPDYVTNMIVTMIEQSNLTHCPNCGAELNK